MSKKKSTSIVSLNDISTRKPNDEDIEMVATEIAKENFSVLVDEKRKSLGRTIVQFLGDKGLCMTHEEFDRIEELNSKYRFAPETLGVLSAARCFEIRKVVGSGSTMARARFTDFDRTNIESLIKSRRYDYDTKQDDWLRIPLEHEKYVLTIENGNSYWSSICNIFQLKMDGKTSEEFQDFALRMLGENEQLMLDMFQYASLCGLVFDRKEEIKKVIRGFTSWRKLVQEIPEFAKWAPRKEVKEVKSSVVSKDIFERVEKMLNPPAPLEELFSVKKEVLEVEAEVVCTEKSAES